MFIFSLFGYLTDKHNKLSPSPWSLKSTLFFMGFPCSELTVFSSSLDSQYCMECKRKEMSSETVYFGCRVTWVRVSRKKNLTRRKEQPALWSAPTTRCLPFSLSSLEGWPLRSFWPLKGNGSNSGLFVIGPFI